MPQLPPITGGTMFTGPPGASVDVRSISPGGEGCAHLGRCCDRVYGKGDTAGVASTSRLERPGAPV